MTWKVKPGQRKLGHSPKCLECLRAGKRGQTYRYAGKPVFKCVDCQKLYPMSGFEPVELNWKESPAEWKAWLLTKGIPWEDRFVA